MQEIKTVHSSGGNSSASLLSVCSLPQLLLPLCQSPSSCISHCPQPLLLFPPCFSPCPAPSSASPPFSSFISLFPALILSVLSLHLSVPFPSFSSPGSSFLFLFFPQISFNFKTFSEVLSVSLPLYLPLPLSLQPPHLFASVMLRELLTIPLFQAVFYCSCGPHLQTAAPAGKNKIPINSNSQLFA